MQTTVKLPVPVTNFPLEIAASGVLVIAIVAIVVIVWSRRKKT
jgi:hypothetical protein